MKNSKVTIGSVIALIAICMFSVTSCGVSAKRADTGSDPEVRSEDSRDSGDEEKDEEEKEDDDGDVTEDEDQILELPEGVITSEEFELLAEEMPQECLAGEWLECYSCPQFILSAKRFYIAIPAAGYYFIKPVVIWKVDNLTDTTLAIDSDRFMTEAGGTNGLNRSFHFEIGPNETQYSVHTILPDDNSVSSDGIHHYSLIDYVTTEFDAEVWDPETRTDIEELVDGTPVTVDFTQLDPESEE